MKEERIILLGGLGYFSTQHLYLNFSSIIQCYELYFVQDPDDIDEERMLTMSKELLDIAIFSKNQTTNLLSELPGLHKDDVLFFQKIVRGYTIVIQLAEVLHKLLIEFFDIDEDEEKTESYFIELKNNAQIEIGKIVGYIS